MYLLLLFIFNTADGTATVSQTVTPGQFECKAAAAQAEQYFKDFVLIKGEDHKKATTFCVPMKEIDDSIVELLESGIPYNGE